MPAEVTLEDVWKQSEKTDRKLEQLAEIVARTSEKVARTSENLDNLGSKWGRFLEGMVAPACETLFAERGIPVNTVSQRVHAHRDGRSLEIDILVINHEYAVLVEVKSTLKVDDVRKHTERLARFRKFFPDYADKRVLGAVAGIVIDEHADKFAYREGLFVIGQTGDTVRILNDQGFSPKTW